MMKIKMRALSLFLSLICALRTEGLSVRGSAMPLRVQLGASVTLPCSVDTPIPLHELEVQWMRDSGSLVHLFLEGESRPESQSPAYSGRAEFFTEEISKGNFSLLLREVTTEDKGMYKCVVHTAQESSEAKVKIDTGFSTLHWCVLGLTMAAAVFAVLSCIPAVWWINKVQKKDRQSQGAAQHQNKKLHQFESKGTVLLFFLQVSVPCILLSIAFAIWGKIESSVGEAYVCCAIHFVRILVIFKVAPYVLGARDKDVPDPAKSGRGPGRHQPQKRTCYERLTNVALPLDACLVRTGINSANQYLAGAGFSRGSVKNKKAFFSTGWAHPLSVSLPAV